ncbi:MAG: hypothetical protein LBJ16_03695 [Holosporaceae bacterium]|nr:hypothetical protein [Holosporaceae bacterium]
MTDRNKIKLALQRSQNFTRVRNLLKFHHDGRPQGQRRPQTIGKLFDPEEPQILSRRYAAAPLQLSRDNQLWATEAEIIEWLLLSGIFIERLSDRLYALEGKTCTLSHVLVFANRKRLDMGQRPFYLDGITEF